MPNPEKPPASPSEKEGGYPTLWERSLASEEEIMKKIKADQEKREQLLRYLQNLGIKTAQVVAKQDKQSAIKEDEIDKAVEEIHENTIKTIDGEKVPKERISTAAKNKANNPQLSPYPDDDPDSIKYWEVDREKLGYKAPSEVAKQAKNRPSLKRILRDKIAIALAAVTLFSAGTAGYFASRGNKEADRNKTPDRAPTEATEFAPTSAATTNLEEDHQEAADDVFSFGDEDIYLSYGDGRTLPPDTLQFLQSLKDQSSSSHQEAQPTPQFQAQKPRFSSQEEALEYMAKNPEFRQGRINGYHKTGMAGTVETDPRENKIEFASAKVLAEMFNNNPSDMTQYVAANECEAFSEYLGAIVNGDSFKPQAIRGLDSASVNQKLENEEETSEQDYKGLQTWFNNFIDMASGIRFPTINGPFENAFLALENPSAGFTIENTHLENCISEEYNRQVTQFYWTKEDGTEATLTIKATPIFDDEGNIIGFDGCMQAITPLGSYAHNNMPSVNPLPPMPGSTPESTPTPAPVTPTSAPVTPTPDPYTPPSPSPDPAPVYPDIRVKPKDYQNDERIDRIILVDDARNRSTDQEIITPTESVSSEDLTGQPSGTDYEGTAPDTHQNNESFTAEQVTPTQPKNNYNQDLGGAHDNEYSPNQPDESAQATANAAEIPISEAPTEGVALDDILAEFGIVSADNEVNRIISEVNSNPTEYAPMEGINIEDILAEYGIQ